MYISVFTANTWNKTSVTVNKNQSSVPNSTLGQCDPPIKAVQSSVQPSTSNKSPSVSTPDADPNAVEEFLVVEPDPADETNFLLSFVTSTRRKFIKSVKALVGAPKISLDGSKICYCKTDGNGIEILKLNVENAAEEDVVIASNFDKCEFSIKPSGDGIVVAKGTQIISIDFDAKQEMPILSGIVDVSLPIYSHDSTKLFYISGDSIFVKEIDEMMPKIVLKLEKNYDAEYLEISRNNKHFLVKYKRN